MADSLHRLLVDSLGDQALFALDPEGKVASWSPAGTAFFGFAAGEIVGRHVSMLFADGELSRVAAGEVTGRAWCVRRDGSRFRAHVELTRFGGAVRPDRATDEGLLDITDSMEAVVAKCSRDLRYVWVSKALGRWLGRTPEEIVGRPIVEMLGEKGLELIRPRFERALAGERVDFEERIDYPSRGPRWIHAVYTPYRDESGDVAGWVSVVTDITERRRIEEALRLADRRKDEFLSFVSHDLRNPLGVITMSVAGLTSRGELVPERVLKAGERIQRAAEQMAKLIGDLLDVASIEAGRLRIEAAPWDAGVLVGEAVDAITPLAVQKGVWIETKLPEDAVRVSCDRGRVLQVLGNLIGNAIKFTRDGTTVAVRVEATTEEARITVSDSGPGISSEQLERVFDRFWQAEQAKRAGHGLGLYIAKGIVESHGARIGAESMVGQGSTFWFTLPLAR